MQIAKTDNIVELDGVSFAYGKNVVLRDITLNIQRGDYLGIIGPNGSGKTTLLRMMLGLIKPSKGTMKLMTNRIGYVAQKATYFESNFPVTVSQVVAMGRYAKRGLLKWPTKEDALKVKEALEEVEMTEFKDRLIRDLSGGQQQRVLIARALAAEPEIIFLDEPTVGVDIEAQERFYDLLKKLNKKMNLTLVLVSHDIDVVTNEVTELACINQTLVFHGTPQKFIKNDYLEKLYGKGVKFILHGH